MSDFNLGTVTAYGYAKDKGYTGTEDEYAELMASYADVAEQAAESAEHAAASATTATAKASEAAQSATAAASSKTAAETAQGGAETAAQTATTKAGEATTAATTATNKATEATTAATTATGKATEAAGSATTATTKAGEASTSATNAAASATRAQEILDSIPEDYSQLTEDVSNLKEDLSNIAETEKWNLLEDVVPIDRTFLNADGITRTNNGTFYFDKVPVEANTVYYFFNEEIANSYSANGYDSKHCARTVLFYDTDGQLIEDGVTYSTYTRSPITTPSNCKYMSICGAYLNGAFDSGIGVNWLTTKAIDKHEDVTYIIASVPIETVTSLNSELNTINNALERLNNVSVQLPNRKPTFAFIFDDGMNGDVNTKALFDSYGFKCGFALVAANYGNADLQALKDRYLPYQSEGFEILSHSVNGTAFDSLTDLSIAESYLKESISKLMSWGFDVRGWVTPSTWLLAEQLPLVEKYYQYGYGHLGGTAEGTAYHQFVGLDIRQLDRWGLEGHTVEQTLAKIDEAIANNAYMILYGHSYPGADNNMTEANMATILSYLKTKADNGEVMVGTPRETINHYYSFRHSDLLDLIDRITI